MRRRERHPRHKETWKTEDTEIEAKKNFKAIKYQKEKRKMSHTGKFRNNSHPKAIINLQLFKMNQRKNVIWKVPFLKKICIKTIVDPVVPLLVIQIYKF